MMSAARNGNDLFSLEGRVAVVTGALGLLGREHCRALASAGATVVATDLPGTDTASLAASLTRDTGRRAESACLDVTRRESAEELLETVLSNFERLDVLVNNAGINDRFEAPAASGTSRFENYPLEAWNRMLAVNVTGAFLCSQVLGAEMARRGAGSIINVASSYGVVAPDQSLYREPDGSQAFWKSPAYPASKAALLSLTRFLAAYWGATGVRVNALSPGGVANGQDGAFQERYAARTPLGRMAEREDYRGAIVFLASDASAYMTGANLIVDGGWTAW
jgi:NAD(P)-dependent dehydrogenase (short-subunit alcohol dehydrogenase family)